MIQKQIESSRVRQVKLARRIIKAGARFFGYDERDMTGTARVQPLCLHRQMVMAVVKEVSTLTLAETGNVFGGRDHGTVLHAIKMATNARAVSKESRGDYDLIRAIALKLK